MTVPIPHRPRARWPLRPGTDLGGLRRQLIILAATISAFVAVALTVVVQVVLAGTASSAIDRVLTDRAEAVVSSIEATSSTDQLTVPDTLLDPGVVVYDDQGQLVAGSEPPALRAEFSALAATNGAPIVRNVGESFRVLAAPFTTTSGQSGVVVLAEPKAPYERDEHYALLVSVIAGLVIVLLATGLSGWASGRALAPVADMARTADEWSEHDLSKRFDLGPPTNEIRALGHTLDSLLDRVANALRAEQRLTSELAHELRTPLTALQATAELAAQHKDLDPQLREDLGDIVEASHTMATTITVLLDLAREEAHHSRDETSSAHDVAEDAARSYAEDARVEVTIDSDLV
ncbi:sensor histidine kinase, partial [Nocardioides sp.]|uniref:sensor histidine kinase n=1 Tax=Nocardioides sp. TaxID=35761 RepID=UPI0035691C44